MAGISLPYRASEPSTAETALAQIATDPARAGAAMALLPGYMSLRQDVGAASQANSDRNYALEVMKQQEAAAHNYSEEGIHAAGISTPGGRALYFGSPSNRVFTGDQAGLVGGLTNLEMNKENADIYQKVMQGNYQGVEGGVATPVPTLQGMTGLPTLQQGVPLQKEIALIHEAGANSRAAASQDQLKLPVYSVQPDPHNPGKLVYGIQSVPPGYDIQRASSDLLKLNQNQAHIETDANGNQTVVPGFTPDTTGVMTNKRTRVPGQMVTVGQGSSTASAGAALPMALREPGGSQGTGAAVAPQGGGGFEAVAPVTSQTPNLPTNIPKMLNDYVQAHPERSADLNRMRAAGQLNLGVSRTGRFYITENGKPVAATQRTAR